MSTPKRKPPTTEGEPRIDRNLELVRRVDAPYYNPAIPDANRYFARHGKEQLGRTVSWLYEHTLADGHPEDPTDPDCRRSIFCVDENGAPVFLEQFQLDMGLKRFQNARAAMKEAEDVGFCEIDYKERRIYITGRIPAAYTPRAEDGTEGPTEVSEPEPLSEEWEQKLCTKFPGYLRKQVEKLDKPLKSETLKKYAGSAHWRDQLFKEGMAQLRDRADEYEHSMVWSAAGIEKRRDDKRRDPIKGILKLTVPEPNFVQSFQDSLYKPKTDLVQAIPPLLTTKAKKPLSSSSRVVTNPGKPTTTKSEPFPVEEKTETAESMVREVMEAYCQDLEDTVVRALIGFCRAKMPDIEPGEICDGIAARGKVARTKNNPAGFLLTAVPNWIDAERIRAKRKQKLEDAERLKNREQAEAAELAYLEYRDTEAGRRMEVMDPGERASRIKLKMAAAKETLPKGSREQQQAMAEQMVRAELRPSPEEWEQSRSSAVGGGAD